MDRTYLEARRWAASLITTAVVVALPAAGLWSLRNAGFELAPVVAVAAAALFSLAIASAGSTLWARLAPSGDLVFGELMLWRMLRRRRAEQRVASAQQILSGAGEFSRGHEKSVSLLIEDLATKLEARDVYTHGHSNRVARFAEAIAKEMGLAEADIAKVRIAGAVHDVGKINTPRAILNKPGRLTDDEFEVIKRHPVDSELLVAQLADPELSSIVRHHHERIDGGGYPDGLRLHQIPLGSRIIAVADTFDAITSSRPYRPGRKHAEALQILRDESGKQLDAHAVRCFLNYYDARRSITGLGFLTAGLPRIGALVKSAFEGAIAGPVGNGIAVAGAAALLTTAAIAPPAHHSGKASHASASTSAAGTPTVATTPVADVVPGQQSDTHRSGSGHVTGKSKSGSGSESKAQSGSGDSKSDGGSSGGGSHDSSGSNGSHNSGDSSSGSGESSSGSSESSGSSDSTSSGSSGSSSSGSGSSGSGSGSSSSGSGSSGSGTSSGSGSSGSSNVLPNVSTPELPVVGKPSVEVPGVVGINK